MQIPSRLRSAIVGSLLVIFVSLAIIASVTQLRKTDKTDDAVRDAVMRFKSVLDAGHLDDAYTKMSVSYQEKHPYSLFAWHALEYRKKLIEVSGQERIGLARSQASVYVGKDVGFVIDLSYDNGWKIDSLDRLWLNE